MADRPMTVYLHDPDTGQDRPYQLAADEFPSLIGVFCDGCRTTVERDYVVSKAMTKPERFEVARATLRREGWQCDESGDWCPTCRGPAPQ
ncbi:hypothetical protein ABZ897_15635 [Nonomuraea sp. NPDC046802]|uniref:hypothetical protein n=1 Tax=Nonomuraea sp. NPDC046802 TaxID=3154919 RepID=UPI0033F6ED38